MGLAYEAVGCLFAQEEFWNLMARTVIVGVVVAALCSDAVVVVRDDVGMDYASCERTW